MKRIATIVTLVLGGMTLGAGCTADVPPTEEGTFTRDEARALGGKTDHILDLCLWMGWYDDGICDEFCAHPDPDCEAQCETDLDCPQPYCLPGGPCPHFECVEGECVLSTSKCGPGELECPTCSDETACVPGEYGCPLPSCPPPVEILCGGWLATECPEGQYCDWDDNSCGYADASGVCTDIPDAWIEIYAPVCGCDGETYGNEGEAHGNGTDVKHEGACDAPPPPPATCDDGEQACIDCEGATFCFPDELGCPLLTCPPPVVVIRECGGPADDVCPDGQYCDWADNSCGAADQMGTCEAMPEVWISIYAPVCGCDGETYGNEGEAHGNGTDVAYEGECEPVDCRSTGCEDGRYCSYCWGSFACIPDGALC